MQINPNFPETNNVFTGKINICRGDSLNSNQQQMTPRLAAILNFSVDLSEEDLKKAEENMLKIISYNSEQVDEFIKNYNGKINMAMFKDKKIGAYADIQDPQNISITYNMKDLAGLPEQDLLYYASSFSHEMVHIKDVHLSEGTQQERAAGSFQEEIDAEVERFRFLQKLWQEGKVSTDELFGKKGALSGYVSLFDINEKKKTFEFRPSGVQRFYISIYNMQQRNLETNYKELQPIYDLDKDHNIDEESVGHPFVEPKNMKINPKK